MSGFLPDRLSWVYVGLTALTIALGMQLVRVMLALEVWVLRDRMHWDVELMGALALAIFATAFLTAPLRRVLGPWMTLIVPAGGLGVLRLAMQVWTGDPLGDLILAIIGVVLFVLYLSTFLGYVQCKGATATRSFSVGLLLGLSIDLVLHGAFSTCDMSWDDGVGTLMVVVALAALQWALLAGLFTLTKGRQKQAQSMEASEGPWHYVLTWSALGPFLFLQMLVFQNLARLVTLTEWTFSFAFGWIVFSHAAGIVAALWVLNHDQRSLWPLGIIITAVLVAALAAPSGNGIFDATLLLVGQVSSAMLLVVILDSIGRMATGSGLVRTTIAHGLGMILLVGLLFGYYAVYDLNVPYNKGLLPLLAGLILGICALASMRSLPPHRPSARVSWLPALLSLVLVIVPLVWSLTWETPNTTDGEGYPVRIMTYNLHNGFNTHGHLDIEAQAQVIEAQRPDVLALQEVSRGWVINGSLDMLTWLSQRLELPYVYGPTAGPLWGNAILTRYPILEWGEVDLPPRDLLILRGFLWARLAVGDDEELLVINTHYHHPEEDTAIRVRQTEVILDFWDGKNRTVILGDLNTRLGEEPLETLSKAGLADAIDLAGVEPGFTTPPEKPQHRIDYIWVSMDLSVRDAVIPQSLASDHLPVVATIAPGTGLFPPQMSVPTTTP
jgi:endonuclease/exonuclease/phosphatase family metal-dependent hydrolase